MVNPLLITGLPGVGKTTIIKKLSNDLKQLQVKFQGFYTEEIRDPSTNERIGFDIVSLDGNRGILARSNEGPKAYKGKTARVGKYSVTIDDFENIALPILDSKPNILIIDEIGKMELFSKKFEQKLKEIIKNVSNGEIQLIATIPCRQNLNIVEEIKSIKNSKLYEITKQNRNNIYSNIKDDALCFSQI